MINSKRSPVWVEAQPLLRTWYSSGLGQSIADELSLHLDTILPRIFGYQGLQVGGLLASTAHSAKKSSGKAAEREFLHKAGIHRKIILDCPQHAQADSADARANSADAPADSDELALPDVSADAINLPIASDIMKLVILPHTLDFCHQPHQALREADRVLTDDGQLVIVGFNPYSLLGAGHVIRGWREGPPWNGHFFSRSRVTEWLSVLNYQVLDSTCLYLRPPVSQVRLLQGMARVEKLQPWFGGIGAVYVLHARKQTIPLTRLRAQRRHQRAGVPVTGFARTSNQNRVISLIDRLNQKNS